jgi:ribosomal protein S18 acetylase RimI-like enzyme
MAPTPHPLPKPVPNSRDIGAKVSVRLHDPTGGFRDILGILESETAIRRKNGILVEFEPNQIAVWRRVVTPIAKAGHGAPLSLRIREIERAASATWPARETAELGDWVLRASGKFTKRANSVLALGSPGMDIDAALQCVVQFYTSRSLIPTIHVALPTYAELDEKLAARGWQAKVHVTVMVADIEPDLSDASEFSEWELLDYPTEEWISVQDDTGVVEIMKRAPAIYTGLRVDGQLMAVGRTSHHNGWTTLTRLYVREEFRGKGIGSDLVRKLLYAAKQDGITKALLQVDTKNVGAIRLYESLGFRTHHTYVYRSLPAGSSGESNC